MGEEGKSFGAIVVASIAVIMGSKYLVLAMVVGMSATPLDVPLLLDSTLVTGVVGAVLVLLSGGFVSGIAFTRPVAILAFAAAVVLAKPWVAPVEPLVIGESMVAATTVLYLLLENPIHRAERTDVDESTSATRIGSTIR